MDLRKLEGILRDADLSRKEAKALLAAGKRWTARRC